MPKVMVKPPKKAQKMAAYYKKLRPQLPKSMQAMTSTGVREMNKTAAGKPRDAEMIVNWFARHKHYIIPALAEGHTPATSKAVGSLYGWGGFAMEKAAADALRKDAERRAKRKRG